MLRPQYPAAAAVDDGRPRPVAPLYPGSVEGRSGRVTLSVVLGLDEAAIEGIVQQTAERHDGADHAMVFLTDLDRFDVFSRAGVVFEHVPSAASRALAPKDLDWDRYLERRLGLLAGKWRPRAIVPFGADAHRLLTAWREARYPPISSGQFENHSYTDEKTESGE